ncbi:MAG: ABC transporter permease [Candidatus Acidiferrales bacterium]
MDTLWQDLRYGLRSLGRTPGFAAAAILTLALGIGANTAIFSVFNQVLLQRLPVKNPNELVMLRNPGLKNGHTWSDGDDAESFSYLMYKGLREKNSVFSGLLARFPFSASVGYGGDTEKASGDLVSGNYFEVLGVEPALGRVFSLDDDKVPAAQTVVVLSHGYWERRFGRNPNVLNQSILVNNVPMTVVGVARAGFSGIQVGQLSDVFVPLMMKAQMTPNWNGLDDWNDYWLAVFGRLQPGMSIQRARAGIQSAYKPLLEEQLPTNKGWNEAERQQFLSRQLTLSPGGQGRDTVQRDAASPLRALMVMVVLVLVLACANIANLLLARGATRQREFAIRAAMGASRWRMIRQLLVESLLCAAAGGALGVVIASWTLDVLVTALESGADIQGLTPRLDWSVLAFAIGATAISGLVFGLLPAWRVTRANVSQTLKEQGSTTSAGLSHVRFRKGLVATQMAFTVLLLAGAGLFTRTLWNLRHVDLGLRTDHLVSFTIAPQLNGYSQGRTAELSAQLRERLAALPGVTAAGSAVIGTLVGSTDGSGLTIPGDTQHAKIEQHVHRNWVSPRYFSVLGVPLLSGREFTPADSATSEKVAIISDTAARQFFPNRDPVGQRFGWNDSDAKPDVEIVGVVKDVHQAHVRDENVPFIYLPDTQNPDVELGSATFYARTEQDPVSVVSAMRDAVKQLDASLPVFDVKTMNRLVDDDLFAERFVASLSSGFGTLAALLAALGIYGVLAFLVVQRSREIGIRMALGAETRHVRELILREVGFMVLIGAAIGLPAAYALARVSESLLYGVRASDPWIYVADIALSAFVAYVACYLPVRRATHVDPLIALRHE